MENNTASIETSSARQIAETITAQLGGRAIFAMAFVGSSYGWANDGVSVVYKIAPALVRHSKTRATHVTVQYQPDDTYTVWLTRNTKRECTRLTFLSMVYGDQLRQVVEDLTGFRLALGTMGRAS